MSKENPQFRKELLEELGLIWTDEINHEEDDYTRFELNDYNLQVILEQARQAIIVQLLSRGSHLDYKEAFIRDFEYSIITYRRLQSGLVVIGGYNRAGKLLFELITPYRFWFSQEKAFISVEQHEVEAMFFLTGEEVNIHNQDMDTCKCFKGNR